MAFREMVGELRGIHPKLPFSYAKTLVNRAYADVRRKNLWSFQLYDANWITPAAISTGVAVTTQGSPTVSVDGDAFAAITASITASTPINNRQFRVGTSGVCNIISFVNPTLTLDRGFPGPSSSGSYSIFQSYYPAPYQDHLTFITVTDMVMPHDLILNKNRAWLNSQDPQRLRAVGFPGYVIPFMTGTDVNNTQTYRFPMYELWGSPQSGRAYQIYGIRKGTDLVAPTDELPIALTEECVMAMAKYYAYEWAEANKGELPRNQGTDWKFLMGATMARYQALYKDLRKQDRETVDLWFSVRRPDVATRAYSYYNSITGTASPG